MPGNRLNYRGTRRSSKGLPPATILPRWLFIAHAVSLSLALMFALAIRSTQQYEQLLLVLAAAALLVVQLATGFVTLAFGGVFRREVPLWERLVMTGLVLGACSASVVGFISATR